MPPHEALRVWRMGPLTLNYAVHKLMNSTPFSSTNKTLDAYIIKSSLTQTNAIISCACFGLPNIRCENKMAFLEGELCGYTLIHIGSA